MVLSYLQESNCIISMVFIRLNEAQFLALGLELVGFKRSRQQKTCEKTNYSRFRASFSCGPKACSKMFRDIQTTNIADARINEPDSHFFLVAVNWLATYKKETEMAGFFDTDEKTLRKHIRRYVTAFQALKAKKIRWHDFTQQDEIFILSVDGVHFRIREQRKDPNSNWYSEKSNGPGLAYEVCIAIHKNRVVWINGPFRASVHDKTMFRRHGLADKIPDGKKVIADRGYTGEPVHKLSIRCEHDSKELRRFKRRVRARHENFNARLKSFNILSECFRHGLDRHKSVFEAVCVICQYDMENGHPLFDVV